MRLNAGFRSAWRRVQPDQALADRLRCASNGARFALISMIFGVFGWAAILFVLALTTEISAHFLCGVFC